MSAVNNPGNIRYSPNVKWFGQGAPTLNGFCTFLMPMWGVRAMIMCLTAYHRHDQCNTLGEIINRWAPPSENDTAKYIADVEHRTGMTADQNVNYPDDLPKLIAAIIYHEQGSNPFTPGCLIGWTGQFYNQSE